MPFIGLAEKWDSRSFSVEVFLGMGIVLLVYAAGAIAYAESY
jgi:hypothetical protein